MRADQNRDRTPSGESSMPLPGRSTARNSLHNRSFQGNAPGISRSQIAAHANLTLRLNPRDLAVIAPNSDVLTNSKKRSCDFLPDQTGSGKLVALETAKEWGVHDRTPTRGPSHEEESRAWSRRPGCARPRPHPDRNPAVVRCSAANDANELVANQDEFRVADACSWARSARNYRWNTDLRQAAKSNLRGYRLQVRRSYISRRRWLGWLCRRDRRHRLGRDLSWSRDPLPARRIASRNTGTNSHSQTDYSTPTCFTATSPLSVSAK